MNRKQLRGARYCSVETPFEGTWSRQRAGRSVGGWDWGCVCSKVELLTHIEASDYKIF